MTAVLAMLFLVLFSALALGFYGATTTSAQVASADDRIARAHLAAESGMDYMRYQLSNVSIDPLTQPKDVFDALYVELQNQINGTGNMNGATISKSGNTILVPAAGSIPLDNTAASRFSATITDWLGEIVVKVDGTYGTTGIRRAFSMDYTRQPHTTSVFNYAIASKGQVVMQKGTITSTAGVNKAIASIMSASETPGAITMSGGTVTGDLNVLSTGTVSITGGTVGAPPNDSSIPATIIQDHVKVVDDPNFPSVDPTMYKPYATNNYVSGAKVQNNILVKAGTNPKFNSNDVVNGIMYIESPNQVTFNGNFNLNGFIVMATSASTTDSLSMKGNLTMGAVPNDAQFNALRATSGVSVLAPNASLSMTGSSGGNFRGNIIVKTFNFNGAADLEIEGTLMTLNPDANSAVFNGSKSVKFSATGSNNMPKVGLTYDSYYRPSPESYTEVTP